jgi:uncharacterized delta-60 repeat protein
MVIDHRLHQGHFLGGIMKPYQSFSAGPAEPSPLRPHPVRFSRARGALPLLLVCCLFLVFLSPAIAADGALDASFNAGVGPLNGVQAIPELRGQVYYPTVAGSPYNGRSLIFGQFYGMTVGGSPYQYSAIARLDINGALDTTFKNAQIFGEIRSVYIYPADDPIVENRNKILIGGDFFVSSGTYFSPRFARLKADGSLDTTFPQTFIGEGAVNSIAVQGSGTGAKILVGGWSLLPRELDFIGPFCSLVRLKYDGTLDTYTPWSTPGGYIHEIRVNDPLFPDDVLIFCTYPKTPDGLSGNYYMLHLNADLDLSAPVDSIGDETVDGPIFGIARQTDGKYVICGQFQKVYNTATSQWVAKNRFARLGSDLRTLDIEYNSVGIGPNDMVEQISPTASGDDRMVLAGNFSTWNGNPRGYLVRLTTSGTLDNTFNTGKSGADDRIMRVNWFSDDSGGLIYGYFRSYNGQPRVGIAGLNADGGLNDAYATVTPTPGGPGMVASLATQSDGKIIIGGVNFNGVGGKYRGGFARLNPDGSLDTSFKGGVNGWVEGVAVQADGKILVAGNFGQCQGYARTSLARLNPDGSLDTAFNPRLGADIVHQVVPLSNGQMMLTGYLQNSVPAVRLNSDGTRDPSFDASGFDIPGSEGWHSHRLAVAGTNYLVAGPYNTGITEGGGGYLVRLTHNGAVDPGFGPSNTPPFHILTTDGNVEDLLLQPDGKIVVSGGFSHIFDDSGSPVRRAIARFSANGLLDNTFTPSLAPPDGANSIWLAAMARQPNGKILIEQNFLNNDTFVSTQIARLNSNGSLDPAFILGNPAGGGYWLGAGNSILRLPNGKALIGGGFQSYNGTPAWSLARIFAGPGNFSPGALYLLLEN